LCSETIALRTELQDEPSTPRQRFDLDQAETRAWAQRPITSVSVSSGTSRKKSPPEIRLSKKCSYAVEDLVGGASMPPASLPDGIKALSRRHAVDISDIHFNESTALLIEAVLAKLTNGQARRNDHAKRGTAENASSGPHEPSLVQAVGGNRSTASYARTFLVAASILASVLVLLLISFSNLFERAYHGSVIPFAGFFVGPITTIVCAWMVAIHLPIDGVNALPLLLAISLDATGVLVAWRRYFYRYYFGRK
jgi:hypothetical protein